jgi:hypothetical protein
MKIRRFIHQQLSLPMKKTSTPTMSPKAQNSDEGCRAFTPKASTVAFLRQFARAYRPAVAPSMPGFVLN